jgi:nitrogen fixation/metabolism regulation signal transduction histidine kinase
MSDLPFSTISHSSKAVKRLVAVGSLSMVVMGLVLLYLLMQATNNRDLYERNYALLFAINVAVAAMLLLAIVWIAYRLVMRRREGRFGSRLLAKLAFVFALAGFAPGLLIYVVSYQFVSRSIETWFDVKVENALDAGLSLGRVTLDTLSNDLASKSRLAATQVIETSEVALGLALERILDGLDATEAAVWTASGKLVSSAGQTQIALTLDRPSSTQFRTAKTERSLTWIEGLEDVQQGETPSARIRVLVPLASVGFSLNPEPRFLLVSRSLPTNLVVNALAVESANREYQERALARKGLTRMYIGTLTLSLFLATFGAILLAVLLGNQLARPLLVLAKGMRQVAAGDLTPKLVMQGKDEMDGLTRDFASMTAQLSDARQAVERSMAQVDAARANLQTILDNLTAGVMVLNAQGEIRSSNPSATRILQVPLIAFENQPLQTIQGLETFGKTVQALFAELFDPDSASKKDHWQASFELGGGSAPMHNPFHRALTIVARGAELPGNARLLVFDDISDIVSAQRAQAWGEVARRLAHEIKNPLTPIQLSAERLEMKLTGKLGGTEQAILVKSVKTIVDQVDAMKRLVDEFRDYARLPAAELVKLDLNSLIREVMHLYEAGASATKIELELDACNPQVKGDGQQLRQVIHNLLQNAQDACEAVERPFPEQPGIIIRTQQEDASGRVRLSVLDSGNGFSDTILKRAFEPYVTTKVKGTGLGLAVVKKIADEHGARVSISNRMENGRVIGAQVSLSLPTYW